jgi:hypothetical protein
MQYALQGSLTGNTSNTSTANEAIVGTIFRPSKVDDQIVVGFLSDMSHDKPLQSA